MEKIKCENEDGSIFEVEGEKTGEGSFTVGKGKYALRCKWVKIVTDTEKLLENSGIEINYDQLKKISTDSKSIELLWTRYTALHEVDSERPQRPEGEDLKSFFDYYENSEDWKNFKGKKASRTQDVLDALQDKSIISAQEDENNILFFKSIQTREINEALTIDTRKKNASINKVEQYAVFEGNNGVSIRVNDFLAGDYEKTSLAVRETVWQLLDFLNGITAAHFFSSQKLSFSLGEYMAARNLKDRKEAKKRLREDIDTLQRTTVKTENYESLNILQWSKTNKEGTEYEVEYGNQLFRYMRNKGVADLPKTMLQTDNRKNPNTYFFERKFAAQKHMNYGESYADCLKMSVIIKCSPRIPSMDEVAATGKRKYKEKIVVPTLRDLTAIKSFSVEYSFNGKTLTEKEVKALPFSDFLNVLVHAKWHDYPDQTKRLEKKTEYIQKAAEAKAAGEQKKQKKEAKSGSTNSSETKQ